MINTVAWDFNTLTHFFWDRVSFEQRGRLHKVPLEIFILMLPLQKAEDVNYIFCDPQSPSSSYIYFISLFKDFPNIDFQALHPSTNWGKSWFLANSQSQVSFISARHLNYFCCKNSFLPHAKIIFWQISNRWHLFHLFHHHWCDSCTKPVDFSLFRDGVDETMKPRNRETMKPIKADASHGHWRERKQHWPTVWNHAQMEGPKNNVQQLEEGLLLQRPYWRRNEDDLVACSGLRQHRPNRDNETWGGLGMEHKCCSFEGWKSNQASFKLILKLLKSCFNQEWTWRGGWKRNLQRLRKSVDLESDVHPRVPVIVQVGQLPFRQADLLHRHCNLKPWQVYLETFPQETLDGTR